tara:strand:- start:357 stop:584 length:228 start_codon:yes stop_codon:yes gene_type:complete
MSETNNVFKTKEYLDHKATGGPYKLLDEAMSDCCSASCIDMEQDVNNDGTIEVMCASCKEWTIALWETNNGENKN